MTEAGRPSATLAVTRLKLHRFRNIEALELSPSRRLNLISGDNGQGKTSILEALYAVATSKSFRTEKLVQAVQSGAEEARVEARVEEAGFARTLALRVGQRSRGVTLDGKRPKTLASYAVKTPVVVFHPRDLELVTGGASERRRLLDRLILYADPPGADARQRYSEALRERQRALELRGVQAAELDAFEPLVAEHGARLCRARHEASARLLPETLAAFARLAKPGLALAAEYEPSGSQNAAEFAAELRQRRRQDLQRGAASYGPHRDELNLVIDGRSARQSASQGQQRVLTLALKLAELACVESARGAEPVLLLDDVSSELDAERTESVFELLRVSSGQIFVTTTRPELFRSAAFGGSERADFRVHAGCLT